VQLISAPDPSREVRAAPRACLTWARRDGIPLHKMAIAHGQHRPDEFVGRSRSEERRSLCESQPHTEGKRGGDRVARENGAVMAVLATVLDVDGRPVDLTDERWRHIVGEEPFCAGHPELLPHRDAVMQAVRTPDHRRAGRRPGEEWFYFAKARARAGS
jgi:hypothetical protein